MKALPRLPLAQLLRSQDAARGSIRGVATGSPVGSTPSIPPVAAMNA